ncbi:AI-2E family transporter [Tepidibacillus sp. HK-1]|uniref:AI-2E family transporter n=1 Tax=Tepidibacillus sp. HK-1 TaxID=1883407 RepID=UPI0008532CF5|nr:AI-2E family transporter [Tepidibacillus sp. HK-1]GBF11938.1 pheromone autoinducer 2 transporter [Tepidibacillus sp. HK-1]
MLSFYKKYGRTAFDLFLIVLTVYLIMYVFSFLYSIGKPIFFALVIFLMIEPLAKFLHKKGLKKITATTISTLVFILVVLSIVITLGAIFATQIYHLSQMIPDYIYQLQFELSEKIDMVQGEINALPPDVVEKAKQYLIDFAEKGSKLLSVVLLTIFSSITSLSSLVVNFVIGVILAYFLSIEITVWRKIANEKTPKTFKKAYRFLKENVIKGIVLYIKAQLKLITFTFIIIFIGLLILRIPNAFSISLLAGLFDLLPLLGVSSLFIPWIIYLLIVGQTFTAIWIAVLLAVVIVFRQIAEPKITGDSLGVSAFTMLSFMVISLSLFGVAGIILSPVLLILIKALYEQGYLKRWIHLPEGEYEQV